MLTERLIRPQLRNDPGSLLPGVELDRGLGQILSSCDDPILVPVRTTHEGPVETQHRIVDEQAPLGCEVFVLRLAIDRQVQ